MGWLRKKTKQIGRGIKKVGKRIGKAFKKVLKPFAKIFNKLGPIGTIAMSMLLPGIGTALAGWGAGMGNVVGTMIKFVGNAIHYVSTAPKKIFGTITDALGASWNTLTGATSGTWKPGSWFDNFSKQMTERVQGDGWFGGKSGSWASFDTTAGLPISDGSVKFNEATKTWQDSVSGKNLKIDQAGKPIALESGQQVYEYQGPFSKAAATEPKLVSDGSVKFNEATSSWQDSVTGKNLKLDSQGQPIALKAGTTWNGQTTSIIGKARSKIGAFRETHDDAIWGAQTGLTALQTYNTFAGTEDIRGGGSGSAFSYSELTANPDQENMYNKPAPTWDPSFMNSILAGASAWNQQYNLPAGFDPMHTPGYGFTWDEWMRTQGGTQTV